MNRPFAGWVGRWLLLAVLAASNSVLAATVVKAVNLPAWLERQGVQRPLEAGVALQSADVITTGKGARVLLSLPEGSEMRIGENAVFRADTLVGGKDKTSLFRATLNVVKGAFRFTTSLMGKSRPREVDIQVATVTAGIRGTDVWGKADADRDVVCLLEGKISVGREGESSQTLSEPLSFFIAPKGQPSLPVSKVDEARLQNEWIPQTALAEGQGVARANGKWRLTVATSDTQAAALQWYDSLQKAGYPARVAPVADGKFKVQVQRLASRADAQALGARLKAELAVPEAVVGR